MYPSIACIRDIPSKKTRACQFKKQRTGDNLVNTAQNIPAANISETVSEYHIVMATPGLRREDFSIKVAESVITISAKKETSPLTGCVNDRCEYDYTDWTRAFALPADADAILAHATYQNGELVIHIPRNPIIESEAKATIYVY